MDGYIRVSDVHGRRGERFISPDVQREAIVRWAVDHNVELLSIFQELDASGWHAPRPKLEQAVQRIESHTTEALVVWRVDRFGRSLADGARIIERIRAVHGGFYSVQDGLDIGTEAGRLVLRILLSVAEYYAEERRANWDIAREHAVRRGIWIRHGAMPGYRKTRSGRLRPDPATAPVMAEVYRRRAAGESLNQLARLLESKRVLTGNGNPGWSSGTVHAVLSSRVYIGEVRHGRHVNPKAHPPLIDPGTWQAAQRPRRQRTGTKYPVLLVDSLARCAGCGHVLGPALFPRGRGREKALTYRCNRYHAAGRCAAPALITAAKLEAYVIQAALDLLARRRGAPLATLAAAKERVAAASRALWRYRDNDRIIATIGNDAFLDGLATRERTLAAANLDLADAQDRIGLHALPPVDEVRRTFPTMTTEQQREFLKQVIDCVFVIKGRGPASARVIVCPAGTAPRRLPRIGDQGRFNRTITPRRGWINPKAVAAS